MRRGGGKILWPTLVRVGICAAFVSAIPFLYAQDSGTTTIRVDVRLVNVFVNITNKSGAPVGNLSKKNFVVLEDGQPQKIAVFERQTDLPLHIVLAIDASGSVRKDFTLEREAARSFVQAILRPADRLELMEFSSHVRELVPFTNDLSRIERGLGQMRTGTATALYQAITLASEGLAAHQGRKVLVVISDGGNTAGDATYDTALDEAVRAEAIVYSIIDVPIQASAGRNLAGEHAMIALAEETGGQYYYTDQASLGEIFGRISADLRTQYLLAYYPSTAHEEPGFRPIAVKLQNVPGAANYTVRNRTGYYPAVP